jgi:hypothetical protein
MTLHSDLGIDAYAAALHRAGPELHENGGEQAFVLSGNTYANKELLKRHGGRWSRSRQAWNFPSLEPIRELATALPERQAAPGGRAGTPGCASERGRKRWRARTTTAVSRAA